MPFENAICATSPVSDTMVPTPNFLCSTRSPSEKIFIFRTCAPSQSFFSVCGICHQSHSSVDSPEVQRKSVINNLFGTCISVYSAGISPTNLLAILLE